MTARLLYAFQFAELGYRTGRSPLRKYTGEPYIVHPIEVAQLVASTGADEDVVIAALFHDLVEDNPNVSLPMIARAFGDRVAHLVHEVTDISRKEHGNRATRKSLDRQHLALASPEGKTIKLADLISNTQSITAHDQNFAKVYMSEKKELLDVLFGGNAALYARAYGLVEAFERGSH